MNTTLLERQEFIKNDITTRLRRLAEHLLQISAVSNYDALSILNLIRECRYLIEWTAPEMEIDRAVELVGIQRQLSSWLFHWEQICVDDHRLQQIQQKCTDLAQSILAYQV